MNVCKENCFFFPFWDINVASSSLMVLNYTEYILFFENCSSLEFSCWDHSAQPGKKMQQHGIIQNIQNKFIIFGN